MNTSNFDMTDSDSTTGDSDSTRTDPGFETTGSDTEATAGGDEDGRINERLDRVLDVLATYLP